MDRRRLAALGLVVALAVVAAGGMAYLRFGRAVPLQVVEAAPGRLAERVTGPGTVRARVPVTIGARITATVREVRADVGDTVRRGQLLVTLDDRDLAARRGVVGGQQEALARHLEAAQATVNRAQADLDLARRRHERDAELLRTGFLSPAALDASDAALKAALANLENALAARSARDGDAQALRQESSYADTMLSFTRIVAPMDGVVVARLAEAGSTVVPGSALLRMVDPATLWVAARVDESVVGRVAAGQAASIRLRTGQTLTGTVARIARESDAATRELEVHVAFDAPPARFAIDQQADVAIAVGDVAGIVLPLSALTRDAAGRQGVLAIVDGRAEFRPVRTGPSDGTVVLVAHGVAAGERVAARGESVQPGRRVRALEDERLAATGGGAWTSR